MLIKMDYDTFEDTLPTPVGTINYNIRYPIAQYPVRTEAMMKINGDYLATALSNRSFVRNSLADYAKKLSPVHKKPKDIRYTFEAKCQYTSPLFLSFTEETSISSSGRLIRYILSSKTYKVSDGSIAGLDKLFRHKDAPGIIREYISAVRAGFTGKYDPANFYLHRDGIYIYFPPAAGENMDYIKILIPYSDLKKFLAYELW
ncbi:MAG: hypothetical protein E7218_06335 [Anaerofustis stercorihominis]|nr:hypothetical protein [Anaerofustis stercorihominis]